MRVETNPINVEITVESESLDRNAFYNVCFITENDVAPRTIEVSNLNELLSHGYRRDSLAYNFCLTAFAQQGIPSVFVRAKRTNETYSEAFSSDSNANYYFVVIDSKLESDILPFNEYLTSADEFKLQFYSSSNAPIKDRKLVHYYSDFSIRLAEIMAGDFSRLAGDMTNLAGRVYAKDRAKFSEIYIVKALRKACNFENPSPETSINIFMAGDSVRFVGDSINMAGRVLDADTSETTCYKLEKIYQDEYKYKAGDSIRLVGDSINMAGRTFDFEKAEYYGADVSYYQLARTAYPEAAWIAECANSFPSRVQWLHKLLVKPEAMKYSEIPENSNTTAIVMDTKATVGSGNTMQGFAIHEQVSLDWVKWAIGRKVWTLLYNTSKLPSTVGGTELIKNEMKNVLDLAIEEGVFSKYHIKNISIAKDKETVKASFSATLMHSILGASISGSLYH